MTSPHEGGATAGLSMRLAALTDALDEPGADLSAILDVLTDDVRAGVPSFLGMAIVLEMSGAPVILTDRQISDPNASLMLALGPAGGEWGPAATPTRLVFYADRAGAFDELADHVRSVLGPDAVVVDWHRTDHVPVSDGLPALADQTTVHQATGVLMDRGMSAAEALAELQSGAAAETVAVAEFSRQILAGLSQPTASAEDSADFDQLPQLDQSVPKP